MNDTAALKEGFEPKQGDEELCARLLTITDRDKVNLFYNVLGAYSGSTHKEWANFREKVERFLPRYERKGE